MLKKQALLLKKCEPDQRIPSLNTLMLWTISNRISPQNHLKRVVSPTVDKSIASKAVCCWCVPVNHLLLANCRFSSLCAASWFLWTTFWGSCLFSSDSCVTCVQNLSKTTQCSLGKARVFFFFAGCPALQRISLCTCVRVNLFCEPASVAKKRNPFLVFPDCRGVLQSRSSATVATSRYSN